MCRYEIGRVWMTAGRLRFVGFFVALCLALMLSAASIWTTSAYSAPKPVPETQTTSIQLLGVNDFHGNLEPLATSERTYSSAPTGNVEGQITCDGGAAGGAAYLDAYMDQYAALNPDNTIRVHAGDMVGGSPLISSYFHDEPTIEATNLMEFDVGTLGNHEFDEGGQEMLRLIDGGQRDDGLQYKEDASGQLVNTSDPDFAGADYPYISANVVYADTGELVLDPYTIVERDGVKVGFIGVTTEETPDIVVPDAVEPFEFLDISKSVDRYSKKLRKQGVETIVVLAHAGGTQTSAEEATGEIISETAEMNNKLVDVIIAGHSHSYLNTTVNDILIVEGFGLGTAFETVNLTIDRATGDVIEASAEVVPTCNAGITPDAETAALVAQYDEQVTTIENRVVGTTITPTADADGESALGDLIADAQRAYAGTQIAFMNPGGIRAPIEAGEVTYGELFKVQPFDNQVVKMELTGDQIYRLLEQQWQPQADGSIREHILQVSGLKITYDESRPVGDRIVSVTLSDGTQIDRNDTQSTYTVAANSFIATGGDGFTVFEETSATQQTLGSDLDALEAYVGGQSFGIPADFGQRITSQVLVASP
jgi:5'-nucleotidase